MSIWKEIPPEILYRRLGLDRNSSDKEISGEDMEAWEHLARLIYSILYGPVNRCVVYKDTVENQVHATLLLILKKKKQGRLRMDDPRRFYGYLCVLVTRFWYTTVRRLPPDGPEREFDEFLENILHFGRWRERTENSLLFQKILEMLCIGDELDEKLRLALKYYLIKESGDPEINSREKLAEKLSEDLGENITVASADQYVCRAKKQITAILFPDVKNKKRRSASKEGSKKNS